MPATPTRYLCRSGCKRPGPGAVAGSSRRGLHGGFTLVELLVAATAGAIPLLAMVGILNTVSDMWSPDSGRVQSVAQARAGFDFPTTERLLAVLRIKGVNRLRQAEDGGRDAFDRIVGEFGETFEAHVPLRGLP